MPPRRENYILGSLVGFTTNHSFKLAIAPTYSFLLNDQKYLTGRHKAHNHVRDELLIYEVLFYQRKVASD